MNATGSPSETAPAPRVTSAIGRTTVAIPTAQTIGIRVDHVVEELVGNQGALRRTLPDVAAEVLEMCGRSNWDAAKLVHTLTRDPFMSAQVVSIANSAMFAPKSPILGVHDAVVRIGLDAVRDVVLMVVANSTMFRVPGFEAHIDALRRRMLGSAAIARCIARVLRVESEYGFLAGLLHDIGELVLLERCAQDGLITIPIWNDPVDGGLVRDRLHAHHTAVGAALCRSWKLPTGVVDAAQFHHNYTSDGKAHLAAHLVAASDTLCDYVLAGVTRPTVPARDQPVLQELGLTPTQIQAIVDEATPAAAALITSR